MQMDLQHFPFCLSSNDNNNKNNNNSNNNNKNNNIKLELHLILYIVADFTRGSTYGLVEVKTTGPHVLYLIEIPLLAMVFPPPKRKAIT